MAVCGPFSHYSMTHEAFGTVLVSLSLSVFHPLNLNRTTKGRPGSDSCLRKGVLANEKEE